MTVNLGVTVGSPLLPNSVNRGQSVNLRVGFLICTVEAIPIPLGGAGEGGAVPRGLYEEHFSRSAHPGPGALNAVALISLTRVPYTPTRWSVS